MSNDGTQYYAGTEDGIVHKCSVSYNEQTLESYFGHTGPVYRLRCSPFLSGAFLSCSADWTCALWNANLGTQPILRFQSGHDSILDVNWAPANSCVFAYCTRDGRVEVWNLEVPTPDPVITYKASSKVGVCVWVYSPLDQSSVHVNGKLPRFTIPFE